jgi:DNA-binding MarR family transcriptional regulator
MTGAPTAPHTHNTLEDDRGLVDALAELSFLVQGTLAKYAAANDLSMTQTRLLGVLRDREPTMQELARLLGLDKSSVTGLVSRAERRELVQREPSRDDRRAIHVRLTASSAGSWPKSSGAFKPILPRSPTACRRPSRHSCPRSRRGC